MEPNASPEPPRSAIERRRLDELAGEIRHDIKAADQHWQSAVEHAIRAGEGLIEAKRLVKHGEWLLWLELHLPGFSIRSAQTYMRLAQMRSAVAHLPSIREAVAVLAEPRTDNAVADSPDELEGEGGIGARLDAGWERTRREAEALAGDGPSWKRDGIHFGLYSRFLADERRAFILDVLRTINEQPVSDEGRAIAAAAGRWIEADANGDEDAADAAFDAFLGAAVEQREAADD